MPDQSVPQFSVMEPCIEGCAAAGPATHVNGCPNKGKCFYDHSGAVCTRCGYYNDEAARKERAAAAREAYAMECLGADRVVFEAGFEAGYAYANAKLKEFFNLVGHRIL